ncbi:MAG: hypothetical protein QXK12_08595 [Candidatus Nezhaarchaeales archaeon]
MATFLKKALIVTIILVIVSPLFGVILADIMGYHEPLDLAAEALELPDLTEALNWTPLLDYTVPGLPATVGYVIAGFIGIGVILSIGSLIVKLLSSRRG